MERRTFIKSATLTGLGITAFGLLGAKENPFYANLKVNEQRILTRINELAKFGRDNNNRGYRVAYTQGDIDGRTWFMQLMKNAGLHPTIDSAGNIIGKRNGKNPSLKPIAFGSHIDMVPDGGNYDGTLGSISALEVIEVLNEQKVLTAHPLEVLIFANEEGGLIGSRAMVGQLTPEGLQQLSQSGVMMAAGIKAIGGNPDDIQGAIRKKGDLHAFLELHIEQGGILENENLPIGVVEGIVGILDCEVTIEGFANHAGTTPMKLRKDALLAASKLVIAVNEVINGVPGSQVGTVGKIQAQPGAYNVVPGNVTLGLEIRDLSWDKIEQLLSKIEQRAAQIANETKTKIMFIREASFSKPALTAPYLQKKINNCAATLGLKTKVMPSGAGHDSQQIAAIAPVGMIFVPSVGGVSHSPNEFTKASDMTNGANVLLQTILSIDRE
ncbi:MAG: Zn-dependent hydrolase [Flammeovirgaceae bacterium]|jgi:beta-ureidopropionase / N-carbamoyl-L-amino-acid hydrolase|nr:Zn-dependent hydrolase [Flammeovirgaceae bacterium]NQW27287.1 Zn-dependent hydrolase [Flammeovirgaceae bacterium]|tara:strand:+ start:148776 stop:150095 length:1320 start_codon:yes stop_codon:yes gene_type:complete